MSAPQALKDELLRLLDEAYDSDGTAISRVEISGGLFLSYEEEASELPAAATYKVVVDATAPQEIVIRLRVRSTPLVWPD